jgi:hypothetical protein
VVLHKRPNPAEAINSPQKEAILGPNFSHTIPAGNPRDIPKFDIDPNNSTEKHERKQYHLNEIHFFQYYKEFSLYLDSAISEAGC